MRRISLVVLTILPAIAGCDSFSHNYIRWLTIIIGAAAVLAFYLQVLKDW